MRIYKRVLLVLDFDEFLGQENRETKKITIFKGSEFDVQYTGYGSCIGISINLSWFRSVSYDTACICKVENGQVIKIKNIDREIVEALGEEAKEYDKNYMENIK